MRREEALESRAIGSSLGKVRRDGSERRSRVCELLCSELAVPLRSCILRGLALDLPEFPLKINSKLGGARSKLGALVLEQGDASGEPRNESLCGGSCARELISASFRRTGCNSERRRSGIRIAVRDLGHAELV